MKVDDQKVSDVFRFIFEVQNTAGFYTMVSRGSTKYPILGSFIQGQEGYQPMSLGV